MTREPTHDLPPGMLRKVVIVGGGTAGWITASVLDRAFNRERAVLDITLIESPEVRRIGVGEATIPTLKRTLSFLGIDEWDFVRATNATFKHSLRFENWAYPGHVYHHPFEAFQKHAQLDAASAWLAKRADGNDQAFADAVGIQAALADAGRAPKRVQDPDYAAPLNYAYHVDADLLAEQLCGVACGRTVRRVLDHVVEVRRRENGDIASVVTRTQGEFAGDLFVDCTGFLGLLHGRALGVGFESYAEHLLCDRAVAFRVPYDAPPAQLAPYTRSRALKTGWMWTVELQNRAGHGYVYSSRFTDEAEAEAELRAELGVPDSVEARHLKMRVGRATQSWVRNCVAIGLSAGFIEPLESTGIYLIEEAARLLVRYFPVNGLDPVAVAQFNELFARLYTDLRDFVVLHYCITRRQDTAFWREVQAPAHIPERLRRWLELWRSRPPLPEEIGGTGLFLADSYFYILYGMGWTPPEALQKARLVSDGGDFAPAAAAAKARALADLPDHVQLLRDRLGAAFGSAAVS